MPEPGVDPFWNFHTNANIKSECDGLLLHFPFLRLIQTQMQTLGVNAP